MRLLNEKLNNFKSPLDEYSNRSEKYLVLLKKYTSKANLISNLRLIIFFLGVGSTIFIYLKGYKDISAFVFLISFLIFIYLIISHEQAINDKKYNSFLYEINEISLKRFSGEWKLFSNDGDEFKDKNHPYSQDLDIFGRGSLFQYINTTSTYCGRHKLRDLLIKPLDNANEIYKRQESITELSEKLDWRQKLQAEGMISSEIMKDTQPLIKWAQEPNEFFRKPLVIISCRILPVITISLGIFSITTSRVPYYIPVLLLILQMLLLAVGFKKTITVLSVTNRYKDNIKIYKKMIETLEKGEFESNYLKELKVKLYNREGKGAHNQIDNLKRIVEDMISMRNHQLYFVFDIITLWDYQCMIALEKWKEKSGANLKTWFDVIGEVEVLSSIAVIKFDHPDWVMPKISQHPSYLFANAMGHPLINDARICNDFKIDMPGSAVLITGSNMSGKSTFLRTVGINLIMAYIGAPVCAKSFHSSIMDVYTSMRVSDNLEENISSFYAELLRIKMIIKQLNNEKTVFYLLDEIFKGTNSRDRHIGAKALIEKLIEQGAVGLVSTHDLELGNMEKENQKVKNYHFKEYYKDSEIHFDYKLRPGISTTTNAKYLMKMAGIEINEKSVEDKMSSQKL